MGVGRVLDTRFLLTEPGILWQPINGTEQFKRCALGLEPRDIAFKFLRQVPAVDDTVESNLGVEVGGNEFVCMFSKDGRRPSLCVGFQKMAPGRVCV